LVILNAATVYNLTRLNAYIKYITVYLLIQFFSQTFIMKLQELALSTSVVVAFLQHYQRSHMHAHTHIYTLRMHDWCDCYTFLLYEITEVR